MEERLEARLLADVKAHEAQFGKNHPHLSHAYLKLAEFHRKHGNPEKEKMWLSKAWQAAEAGIVSINPLAGLAIEAISAYHRRNGDTQAASKVYDDAVEVISGATAKPSKRTAGRSRRRATSTAARTPRPSRRSPA